VVPAAVVVCGAVVAVVGEVGLDVRGVFVAPAWPPPPSVAARCEAESFTSVSPALWVMKPTPMITQRTQMITFR
jgi:hypothetical protein